MRPLQAFSIVVGLIFIIFLLPSLLGLRVIDPGEVGVVTRWGRVTGRVLDPGAHWVVPVADSVLKYNTKKVTYETTTEEKQKGSQADYKDFPVDTNTSDGQQVDIFYTIRFSVDPTKAQDVAQRIGSQEALVEKIVKTESRIWVRNVPREFEADELYTGNVQQVQEGIFDKLDPTFAENGLILDSVGIREIKFTDEYVRAIEEKQIEAVKVETEQNRAEQAKFQKEAAITQAEASAEAQRLQRETLDQQVIQKLQLDVQREAIAKWNGNVPQWLFMGQEGLGGLILNAQPQ